MISEAPYVVLDSITDATEAHRGRIVLAASHGGLIVGALAARAGLRAVILNDAGVGLDQAGIAGLAALDGIGMAACAIAHDSADIGNGADMARRGRLSVCNATAQAIGLKAGFDVRTAAALLVHAPLPLGTLPVITEARRELQCIGAARIVLVDSGSQLRPEDDGAIVVTGSHGALLGGLSAPLRSLPIRPRLVTFNDAGGGPGFQRLDALEAEGIACVTVSHSSARIGDASSCFETGVINGANDTALTIGLRHGDKLDCAVKRLVR